MGLKQMDTHTEDVAEHLVAEPNLLLLLRCRDVSQRHERRGQMHPLANL